ncbi:hypothetical protein [Helicobacter mustelae]|uniref:Outer membrane protein n=1 Tax=Helicobacter mustelae (strain ATCC 43772 / CCUG 25715 / CIP 103759 / LMG 18044 / NCTC 12198 / R85-136P) TaxID=679897 RepID=D3UG49_HELM1|nr:hypothetical protein [Helicobacter mustelae]CBG39470.1 Putative hypothetical protein [Helicobacter mustelae 12198]SQH70983.1 Uncharacterised protein [Helicobacter mustelae]
MHNKKSPFKKQIFLFFALCFFGNAKQLPLAPEILASPATSKEAAESLNKNAQKDAGAKEEISTSISQGSTTPSILRKDPKRPYRLLYGMNFDFFLDNTEESQAYWPTRTLFAGSIKPEIGIEFYNQKLLFGGYFIQNMGEKFPSKGGITFSYSFEHNAWKGYFGIFPKKYWIGKYSKLFYRKDFLFFNPMSSGILFQYDPKDQNLQAELLFDWYGGNLAKRLDEFLVQGYLNKNFFDKVFYLGGSFLLNHFKNDEFLSLDGSHGDTYLLDRLYYEAYVGINLESYTKVLDALNLKLSALGSIERKRRLSRGNDPFSNLWGSQVQLITQYKGFGVDNRFYAGKSQMLYFSQYGENFYSGLPFYRSPLYDRLELYYEYKNDYFTGRFSFITHFTQKTTGWQQMLTISLNTHKLFDKLFGK